jgi:hypothetical protein
MVLVLYLTPDCALDPDPRLLDGSVIPPVVPNLIYIRWLNCPLQVVENPTQ